MCFSLLKKLHLGHISFPFKVCWKEGKETRSDRLKVGVIFFLSKYRKPLWVLSSLFGPLLKECQLRFRRLHLVYIVLSSFFASPCFIFLLISSLRSIFVIPPDASDVSRQFLFDRIGFLIKNFFVFNLLRFSRLRFTFNAFGTPFRKKQKGGILNSFL